MGNKPQTNKKRFLYPDEYQRMLEHCNPNQVFTFESLINTGARINEMRNVEHQDLDSSRNTINLRVTKVRAKLKEVRPTPRIISVSSKFFRYFKKNLGKRKILSTNASDVAIKIALIKIKVKDPEQISIHKLRKTFGTWMLALGCDGFKIAHHLGHTPNELAKDYATNDVFNANDKQIMRELLGDLPSKFYPQRF